MGSNSAATARSPLAAAPFGPEDANSSVTSGFDVNKITASLPGNLQQEVLLYLHEDLVRQVPMFEGCDDSFIKALVMILKPQVLLKGDCAFKVHESGQTMYFIQHGCIQITDAEGTTSPVPAS